MPLTVGTAGHVDHGKTTLVRALTGKDTDRLPEERARGISIDLGYAPLELPSGRTLSLVDVPGHERFVRTMVAGATGIDLFLLVLDAAEGARPQTHEHLAILRLLGVERGVVAVTKADTVDEETLELALEEARELVPGAPVVAVSGVTGDGLDALREALDRVAGDVEQRRADYPTRLYVDRVFTLRGIGTIATGTLWSGRSPTATGFAWSRRDSTFGSAPCRFTTRPSRALRRGSVSRSACRGSSGATSRAATRSSRRAPSLARTASRCHSTSWSRSPTVRASPSTTGRAASPGASSAWGRITLSCGSRSRCMPRAATGSCSAERRRSAARSSSIPRRPEDEMPSETASSRPEILPRSCGRSSSSPSGSRSLPRELF